MNPLVDQLKNMYHQLFFTDDPAVAEEIEIHEADLRAADTVPYFCEMAQFLHNFWPDKVAYLMKQAEFYYDLNPTKKAAREIRRALTFIDRL